MKVINPRSLELRNLRLDIGLADSDLRLGKYRILGPGIAKEAPLKLRASR
jgi:hypothetical protein